MLAIFQQASVSHAGADASTIDKERSCEALYQAPDDASLQCAERFNGMLC